MMSPQNFLGWLAERCERETRGAVGEKLGVTPTSVGLWLSGARHPSRTVLLLAERILRENAGEWPL
jgi:hypothetical protein